MSFFFKRVHLLEKKNGKDRDREIGVLAFLVTPQVPGTMGTGQAECRSPEIPSGYPVRVAGPQALVLS